MEVNPAAGRPCGWEHKKKNGDSQVWDRVPKQKNKNWGIKTGEISFSFFLGAGEIWNIWNIWNFEGFRIDAGIMRVFRFFAAKSLRNKSIWGGGGRKIDLNFWRWKPLLSP